MNIVTLNRLILAVILALGIAGCTTLEATNCTVRLQKESSEFSPKIADEVGVQILFTIHIEDMKNCTSSEIDRLSGNIFKDYAKKHGYADFKILQRQPDKVSAYRYVVVFN